MDISQIPQRIEIAFWIAIIPLMKESSLMGFLVREGYILLEKARTKSKLLRIIAWAMSGLFLGFLLGFLISYIQ
jgi:hypothetical protein